MGWTSAPGHRNLGERSAPAGFFTTANDGDGGYVLDDLIQKVQARTGITPEKAHQAVDTVVSQLKTHLPAPVATHIDEVLSGNFQGTIADVEQKFKQHFGGLFK